MSYRPFTLVLLLAALGLGSAFAQSDRDARTPETAVAEIRAVLQAPYTLMNDPAARSMTREQRDSLFASSSELTIALGEKFLRDYPQDPLRWDAIQFMLSTRPAFTGAAAEERKAAWAKRREELVSLVLSDDSVRSEVVANVAGGEVMRGSEDPPALRRAIETLRRRAADAPMRPMTERMYLEGLARSDGPAAMAEARQLAADSNAAVAETARTWIQSVEYKTKPLDLKFPDLDGREIDLSKYRGKIVLLDFWATWCVPCMEQMPHLVEVYEKYHSRGFEVIGVTDDIPPRDPAKPRPVEKTVPQLKEFLAKHNMHWPQLWDTRVKPTPGPKGLLQQFGVGSLPTYLLFDQNGMFVTADLRGPKLEAAIEKLLAKKP